MTTTSQVADLYAVADAEANEIVNLQSTDKNAQIVQGIVKTNESQKQHYVKVRTRWSNAEKITVTTLTVSTILIGIVCIILPLVDVNNDVVFIVLGSIGTVLGVMSAILQNCFNKKKKTFSLIITLYNKKIDQCYILWKKAITDGVITEDELTLFNTINNQTILTTDEQKQELDAVKIQEGQDNPVIKMFEDLKGMLIDNIDKVKSATETIKKV
jgi:hypothetical protein